MDFEKPGPDETARAVPGTGERPRPRPRRILRSMTASALLAFCVFMTLTVFYKPTITHGGSMEPTLSDGDRAFAMVYRYVPARGDVVIIKDARTPGKYLVKRIIGLPGDVIDINFTTGEVLRDGAPLSEPYAREPTTTRGDMLFPLTVPESHAFVLGDNRNHSTDSRTSQTGMIPLENIEGRMVWRFYPMEKFGAVK